jgi:hypothetical protein
VFFAWAALRPVKEDVIEEVISEESDATG